MPVSFPSVAASPYRGLVTAQIHAVQAQRGKGDLSKLLRTGDTWEVRA